MNTQLKPGDTAFITDYCGMMGFDGTYIGLYQDRANMLTDNIMVFSYKPTWQDAPPIRYAGCIAVAGIYRGYSGNPDSYGAHLVAHYYGDSIETLAHVTREQKPREWTLQK